MKIKSISLLAQGILCLLLTTEINGEKTSSADDVDDAESNVTSKQESSQHQQSLIISAVATTAPFPPANSSAFRVIASRLPNALSQRGNKKISDIIWKCSGPGNRHAVSSFDQGVMKNSPGFKVGSSLQEITSGNILPFPISSTSTKRIRRHVVFLKPKGKRSKKGRRQKKRKRKKRKKMKKMKHESFKRHKGQLHHSNLNSSDVTTNSSTRNSPDDMPSLDMNRTTASEVVTPVLSNNSLVKLLTARNGKFLLSGHEMFVAITASNRDKNRKSTPRENSPLVVDHEVSVSVQRGDRDSPPKETGGVIYDKIKLMSPLQMLSSNTLSWLPYNPNIRVSIQVVGDLPSLVSTTVAPSPINIEGYDLHNLQPSSQDKEATIIQEAGNGQLVDERPVVKEDLIDFDSKEVNGQVNPSTDENRRRKKFIITAANNRNYNNNKWTVETRNVTNLSGILAKNNSTRWNNDSEEIRLGRGKENKKKQRNNESNKKHTGKNKELKGHRNLGAAWELVSGLAAALEDLLKSNGNPERSMDISETVRMDDACSLWASCRVEKALKELARLPELPTCPCFYPADLVYQDALYDPVHNKTFRWLAINGKRERIDVYRRGAHLCVRSRVLPYHFPRSLAAQTCCYNRDRRLITRGSGAGTPELASPQVSTVLHRQVDILPWLTCHGNFLRYQEVRVPDNGQNCLTVPNDQLYRQQVFMATDY